MAPPPFPPPNGPHPHQHPPPQDENNLKNAEDKRDSHEKPPPLLENAENLERRGEDFFLREENEKLKRLLFDKDRIIGELRVFFSKLI